MGVFSLHGVIEAGHLLILVAIPDPQAMPIHDESGEYATRPRLREGVVTT
jgi:hypothetical protein